MIIVGNVESSAQSFVSIYHSSMFASSSGVGSGLIYVAIILMSCCLPPFMTCNSAVMAVLHNFWRVLIVTAYGFQIMATPPLS